MSNIIQFTPRPTHPSGPFVVTLPSAWSLIVHCLGTLKETTAKYTYDPRVKIYGMNFQKFDKECHLDEECALPTIKEFIANENGRMLPLSARKSIARWIGVSDTHGLDLLSAYDFYAVLDELCRITGHPELREMVLGSKLWKRCTVPADKRSAR